MIMNVTTIASSVPTLLPHTARFLEASRRRVVTVAQTESPKMRNWSQAFFEIHAKEPSLRRRQALAFAHALRNEPVILLEDELLVGQIYQVIPGAGSCDLGGSGANQPMAKQWANFDAAHQTVERVTRELPELAPLNGEGDPQSWLAGIHNAPGHIGWHWDWIVKDGVEGLFHRLDAAEHQVDAEGREFLDGMRIVLQALLDWAARHADELENRLSRIPEIERAEWLKKIEICRRVPRHGARSFREALQSFHLSYLATIFENPHGGNGPGRLDYHLWPYLEKDLAEGVETLESARELIDELFIRFHERLGHTVDGWVETIVVGGSHPDGRSAVNPLSKIMIESIGTLKISHPSVYVRVPENAPDDWYDVAARDVRDGGNRSQVLSDRAVVAAMTHRGDIPVEDARMYMCGGCMEISPHGMNGDLLFAGFFNTAKVLELVVNGGRCLNAGRKMLAHWNRTLADFATFEELYAAFEPELRRALRLTFRSMDIASEECARNRPRFLVSSQVDDCIQRGRGINNGGARYEDYGSTPLGIPNLGDSLYAIQRAVFEEKFVSGAELLAALQRNFSEFEALRARLRALPKFGQGHAEADAMTNRVLRSVCDAYDAYRNRFGRRIKPMIMTFMMAPIAGRALGATPDGRLAGTPITQGLTPQSMAMEKGLTTAIASANSLDLHRFAGGASSMWDLDAEYATHANLKSILKTFLGTGGQMYQGNTTDVRTLEKARQAPDHYPHLLVRVGGYSGRFTTLSPELQDEIIARKRHRG